MSFYRIEPQTVLIKFKPINEIAEITDPRSFIYKLALINQGKILIAQKLHNILGEPRYYLEVAPKGITEVSFKYFDEVDTPIARGLYE